MTLDVQTQANAPNTLPPWEASDVFPERPATSEYGFMAGKKLVPCTQDELMKRCSRDEVPPIHLVWTPENSRLVPPVEVAFLFERVKTRARSRFKSAIVMALLQRLIWAGMYWVFSGGASQAAGHDREVGILMLFNLLCLGLLPRIGSIRALMGLRHFTHERALVDVKLERYGIWVSTRPIVLTWVITVCLMAVGAVQLTCGLESSIAAAGVVKENVWQGEVWRLGTGCLLHGARWWVYWPAI